MVHGVWCMVYWYTGVRCMVYWYIDALYLSLGLILCHLSSQALPLILVVVLLLPTRRRVALTLCDLQRLLVLGHLLAHLAPRDLAHLTVHSEYSA
jgi:hypothetical protein